MKGEVIGINSAIFSPAGSAGGSVGIGFAIPTALAKPVIAQLKEFGRTHRGWLGVKIQDVSEEIADSLGLKKEAGALVLEVAKGSPADKAGIVAGDVITSFDGKEIGEMRSLPRLVAETKAGKTANITYIHKNDTKTAQITIAESDEKAEQALGGNSDDEDSAPKEKQDGSGDVLGMQLAPLNQNLRARLRVDSKLNGLVVLDVKAGSAAAKRGLMGGDLLIDVNNEPVKTVSDFKKSLENAKKAGRNFVLIRIARAGEENFVTLPISDDKK
jgi:serine protease Do